MKLDIAIVAFLLKYPLVMVVDRDGEDFLCFLLADDVLIKERLHLARFYKVYFKIILLGFRLLAVKQLVLHDLHAHLDAFVADEHSLWTCDQLFDLVLGLAAKGTSDIFL